MVDKKVIEKLKTWGERTTFHGIPNITTSERTSIKIIWIFSFVVCTVYCGYVLSTNIMDFLQFEVQTVVEINRDINSEFPTVSFCALQLCGIKNINQSVVSILQDEINKDGNLTKEEATLKLMNISTHEMVDMLKKYYFRTYPQNELKEILEQNKTSVKNNIISCQFSSDFCNDNDFEYFQLNEYQRCYKFNSGRLFNGSNVPIKTARRYGKNYGLQLELFLGFSDNCKSPLRSTYGLILYVHNNTYNISYDSYGILLAPGTETNIAVDRTYINRKPNPYSDCVVNKNNQNYATEMIENTFKITSSYTQQTCLHLCYQEYIISNLKCYNPYLPYYDYNQVKACSKLMNLGNESIAKIYDAFYTSSNYEDCLKECPIECEYVNYDTTASSSQFPTMTYTDVLVYNENISSNFNSLKGISQFESVKSSTLSLNVFYKSDLVTQIRQKPSIVTEVFVSNIGGTLGLFLGVSLLSFVEIFEFFIEVLVIYLEKLLHKPSDKNFKHSTGKHDLDNNSNQTDT